MLADYDAVLSEVVSLPEKATKYLNPKVQNELIDLLSKAVISYLASNINKAPFWSLILDSTSDITRTDQLSILVRWVQIKDDKYNIVESFLGFVKIADSMAENIANTAKTFLEYYGLDFSKIRGQGYYGANVMSGIHAYGMQTLIKNMVDSPVTFVHCGSHNLNLVISDSVGAVAENDDFLCH